MAARRYEVLPLIQDEVAGLSWFASEQGDWVLHSDHAAELARVRDDFLKMNNLAYEWRVRAERAEASLAARIQNNKGSELVLETARDAWRTRAERAEAYVAGQDVRSDFRNAGEMRAVLDFARKAWEEEIAENTLLRAECEAWKHRYESKCPADAGTAAHTAYYTEAAKKLKEARAATDAAGALKGVE